MKYVALMLASYVLKQARINIDVDNRLCIVPIFFFFFFFVDNRIQNALQV